MSEFFRETWPYLLLIVVLVSVARWLINGAVQAEQVTRKQGRHLREMQKGRAG